MLVKFPPANLWRVHAAKYAPREFHPGGAGNARFSPLSTAHGKAVPTLYAATSVAAALMETVFHEVPTPPGDYLLDLAKLEQQALCVSTVRPVTPLLLVDLSTKGLQRLGLKRTDLIDTPPRAYPHTRAWAAWFHREQPTAQGLLWTSRKDDEAKSLMLFGDRIRASSLTMVTPAQPIHVVWRDALLDLAEHIGILQVLGPHR
jgi:RES domain-containing protein